MAFEGLKEKLGPLPVWAWGALGGVGVGIFLLMKRGTPAQTPVGGSLSQQPPYGSGSDEFSTIAAQLDQLNSNIRQLNFPPIYPPPPGPTPTPTPDPEPGPVGVPLPIPPFVDSVLQPWLGTTNYFTQQLENLRYNMTLNDPNDIFANTNEIANKLNLAAHSIDYTQSAANVQQQQFTALEQFKTWVQSNTRLGTSPNAGAYQGYLVGWLAGLQNTITQGANNTAANGTGAQSPRIGNTDSDTSASAVVTSTSAYRVQ